MVNVRIWKQLGSIDYRILLLAVVGSWRYSAEYCESDSSMLQIVFLLVLRIVPIAFQNWVNCMLFLECKLLIALSVCRYLLVVLCILTVDCSSLYSVLQLHPPTIVSRGNLIRDKIIIMIIHIFISWNFCGLLWVDINYYFN